MPMLMLPGGYSSMIQALLLIALIPLAAAQEKEPWPWWGCGNGNLPGNYSAGSTLESNLLGLLGTLGQKASSSGSLFAKDSFGAAPDTVWGVLLCRGDVNASDCSSCVTRAGRDAWKACNHTRNLALGYDQCYVRVASDRMFFDSGLVSPKSSTYITSTDIEGYARAVLDLLRATVQYAVENPLRRFATGHRVGPDPGFQNIYSAAQCAADQTRGECQKCLQDELGRWWDEFPHKWEGTGMARPQCTLRSDLARFYNGPAMVVLPTAATTTGSPRTVAIVIGLVVPLLVIASLAAAWFWCRRRYRPRTHHKTQEKKKGQQGDSKVDVPRHFPYEELVQATDNFSQNKKLGQGAFGAVYEGTLASIDTTVAIKEILDTSSDQTKKAFDSEIKIMSQLHHRNILSLKGWCEEDKHLLLIYEIMENGSLEDHLYPKNGTMDTAVYGETDNGTRPSPHLSWLARHNILIGIASGLAYLHTECRAAIVHRDLKPANVMLDKKFNAKLADFGLVTQVSPTQTSRSTGTIIGTQSYIDPAYRETGKVSGQCDVYSLGVVLLEIVCGAKPSILQDSGKNSLIEMVRECDGGNRILDAADKGLRGQFDKEIEAVLRLGLQCVLPDRHNRPHAGRVRDRLTELLENGNGLAGSTSQQISEEELGMCATMIPTHSLVDEEAGITFLLGEKKTGEKKLKKPASLPSWHTRYHM